MSSKSSRRMSVTRPVKGGLFPLKPRRRFAKSPAHQSPAKTTDRGIRVWNADGRVCCQARLQSRVMDSLQA